MPRRIDPNDVDTSWATDWCAWMHYPMWTALGVLGYDAGRALVGECEALAHRLLFGPDFEEAADDEFIIEAY